MYDLKRIVQEVSELPSITDLDKIVNDILKKTLSIVQADAGLLWEYEEGTNNLACKAYSGIARDIALSLRLELGEGLIGKTYLRGTPKLYSSLEEIRRDIDDFSDENKRSMEKIFGNAEINSAYLMPIFVDGRIECILTVYRAQGTPPFSAADIETLKILSELIEITLSNARGLLVLQSRIGSLKKCNDLYATLTHFSVENSGIPNIVDELRRTLEIPVWVINLMTNEQYPRSAPNAPYGRNALDEGLLLAELPQLNGKDAAAFLAESKDRSETYRVRPILAENSCLGYLVVTAREAESPFERMLLEVGQMVLAVEFSKAQSRLDISYKRMAQGFSELVSAKGSANLAGKCGELGIHVRTGYAVAVFAFLTGEGGGIQEAAIYRVIAKMKKELRTPLKLIFSSEERIIALVSVQTPKEVDVVAHQVVTVVDGLVKGEGLALSAGMGGLGDSAGDIGKSFREAEKALSYQVSRRHGGLLQYSDMGINQVFINLSSDEAASFLSSVLAPLARKSENLETTLIAYIESSFSLKETARQLYIHPNTLYQRLKKIEGLLGISFRNPDDLLKLQLARYLRNYYPDTEGTGKP
jgi:sugar diacid utilization regulator